MKKVTLSQVVKNKNRYSYSEAVAMGFNAQRNGIALVDNPMPIGTILGLGWLRGWQEACKIGNEFTQGDW